MSVQMILLVIALILFLLAAIGWPASRVGLGWLAAFFVVLSLLVK